MEPLPSWRASSSTTLTCTPWSPGCSPKGTSATSVVRAGSWGGLARASSEPLGPGACSLMQTLFLSPPPTQGEVPSCPTAPAQGARRPPLTTVQQKVLAASGPKRDLSPITTCHEQTRHGAQSLHLRGAGRGEACPSPRDAPEPALALAVGGGRLGLRGGRGREAPPQGSGRGAGSLLHICSAGGERSSRPGGRSGRFC